MNELGAYGISTLEAEPFTGTIKSVSITDTIETNGQLNLVVKDTDNKEVSAASLIAAGYDIEWKKGTDVVTRTQVMYGKYTMSEDRQWVNVVYDKGAQTTYTVTISRNGTTFGTANSKVNYNDALVNGSFEQPQMTQQRNESKNNHYDYNAIHQFDENDVPGWKTTASDHKIEIGNVKLYKEEGFIFTSKKYGTVESYSCSTAVRGDQIAELNCTQEGALYQDVLTEPGAKMNWSLSHRGRKETGENMALVIAPYSDVKNITTQAQLTAYIQEHEKDDNVKVVRSTKDARVWKTYSGEWDIPEGQYLTRFFFVSLEGDSVGNLLDNVWFSTDPVPPTEGEGQLTVTKEFYGLDGMTLEQVQAAVSEDFLTYTASGSSETVTPDLQWGVGSGCYTASFSITPKLEGADTITYTVTEDTSKAQIPGYTLTSTGTDKVTDNKITKTATVSSGETQTLTFENTYTPSTTSVTITKTVTGIFGDVNKEFSFDWSYGTEDGQHGTVTGVTMTNPGKIENVPVGATLTITETEDSARGYTTTWSCSARSTDLAEQNNPVEDENGELAVFAAEADERAVVFETEDVDAYAAAGTSGEGTTATITVAATENVVHFVNDKDGVPDTGISLDSLPYILMLTFAGAASILLALRKRHNFDI